MIAILTAMILPLARYSVRRQDEVELRYQLRLMRDAIDKYKQYSDAGADSASARLRGISRRT